MMGLGILALNVLHMNAKFDGAAVCVSVSATAGSFRQRAASTFTVQRDAQTLVH